MDRATILVVYALHDAPLRSSVEDHLYAFARHSGHRVLHLNAGVRAVPDWLLDVDLDLIVFHTSFLSARWVPRVWAGALRRVAPLQGHPARKVALPQDEFLRADDITAFVRDFGVSSLCSVAPPSQWSLLYPELQDGDVQFRQVLTGYLDDATVKRIDAVARTAPHPRPVDVGYRAWHAAPWLGRHGRRKTAIAAAVRERAGARGLRTYVSTRPQDQLTGGAWFTFLSRCAGTVGVEGGASIADRDGSLKAATERYLALHPDAAFEEVEAACFPGRDGETDLRALSPRHLEACATRTCQLLIQGAYNGVLEPGRHYAAVREDLADLDVALDVLGDERARMQLVECAYEEVVASGRWSYARLVRDVETAAFGPAGAPRHPDTPASQRALRRGEEEERRAWRRVAVQGRVLRTAVAAAQPVLRPLRRVHARRVLEGARR